MLVSIITPSYNSAKFISETIESVLAQSYQNWEMIIVDDHSSDNSIRIIKNYIKKGTPIKLITLNKNRGVAHARNVGLANAKGEYITFLDSDDVWSKDKLNKQITFMENNNYILTYTAYHKINESGEKIGSVNVPVNVDYKKMLKSNYIACSSAIVKKELLDDIYFPPLKLRQDHAFWLSLLKKGIIAYGLNKPLLHYRVRKKSISSNKAVAAYYQWKLYREFEKFPIYKSVWYLLNYSILGIVKYFR